MMTFLSNIFLSIVWATMTGDISHANLTVGFALSFCILWFMQPAMKPTDYFRRCWLTISFLFYFIGELITANWRVFIDVVTPTLAARPAIVALPLDATTDLEITLLACLITLTPGTLSLDVSDDRKVLYVHDMFVDDALESKRTLKEGLERRLLEVLR